MTLTFTGVVPAAADVPAGAGVCPPPHAASINTDAAAARAARVLITELLQGVGQGDGDRPLHGRSLLYAIGDEIVDNIAYYPPSQPTLGKDETPFGKDHVQD
ncbi:hypothetical protein [Nonomuraea sp. PA05]|uniref:hypothetical protein n=1 Tax=Nonomuraea sp. PA05 TaxID=2604466 RepID=UPI0016526FCA|nr:hypothetical protein [Nonomuraea sp. PA05]